MRILSVLSTAYSYWPSNLRGPCTKETLSEHILNEKMRINYKNWEEGAREMGRS